MSWDLAQDTVTGDIVFSGNRDLLGAIGHDILRQRFYRRMKIPRGSWRYDVEKQLGSRLYEAMRYTSDRALREIPVIIQEALAPMDDISIIDVEVLVDPDDPRQIVARIRYAPASLLGSGVPDEAITGNIFTAEIPLPSGTYTFPHAAF